VQLLAISWSALIKSIPLDEYCLVLTQEILRFKSDPMDGSS